MAVRRGKRGALDCTFAADIVPKPAPADPFAPSRARAEHLCLWLARSRVLCRNSRHCHGRQVNCLADNGEPQRPLLEQVGRTFGEG